MTSGEMTREDRHLRGRAPARHAVSIAAVALCLLFGASAARAADSCEGLKTFTTDHVTVQIAQRVEGSFTEDIVTGRAGRTYTGLRAFCRVRGISRPVPGSQIGFELWMPEPGWNGRLHMVGNGAYVSNLPYKQMIARIEDGDATVATDTGHQGTDLKFGWRQPEKIADFGHRAVHESAVAAKAIVAAFYRRPARYAYFSGCSTGGYQGLAEAQRHPEDFNGIIAGAPGNNRTHLTMAFLWNYLANHRPGDDQHPILTPSDLLLINRAVVKSCDGIDKVVDGVVSDPRQCHFRLTTLSCQPGAAPGTCLTPEQVGAAQKIYDGPKDARTGAQIYPGYPFGTEGVQADAQDKSVGWSGYWSETARADEPSRADLFRYWVFDDPNWNWWTFDWGKDVDRVDAKLSADFNATSTDLSGFSARGGRLMMFMGWQDPVGTPYEAINYYNALVARAPGRTDAERQAAAQRTARLYMIPGMDHCAGGPGATNVSTATRDSVPPIRDAQHDMLLALEAWVEGGQAPGALIGTHYAGNADAATPRPIAFQRPICVFPARPEYIGGPKDAASSFSCVAKR
jgi:feruloyl esterase